MGDLNQVKKEYEETTQKLGDPELISSPEKLEELSKKYRMLKKTIEKLEEIDEIKKVISENEEIVKAREDSDLVTLAEQELTGLFSKKESLEKELKEISSDEKNGEKALNGPAIIEIRGGTGGDEAALFAAELFRMYTKYAQKNGWKTNVLSLHSSDLDGIKEVIFEINDKNAFSKLQFESGVHRIQRIPETEKSGRIHTSTVTVAVLPKPTQTQMILNPQDLKIDTFRSSGPGGQLVNKRESAVRITHLPTGIVVASQQARTQAENREYALSVIRAKLLAAKIEEENAKISKTRKTQIGTGERSEKIRTYNFPQDRITDHRIKKNWHHIEKIIDGNIEEIIEELEKQNNQ